MNWRTVDLPDPFKPISQLNCENSILKSTSDLKLFAVM